jgi:osmotically-inducible protein OsmY
MAWLWWLGLGVGVGVAGAALLSPRRGAARRARLRDQARSRIRNLGADVRGRLIDARQRARGVIHEAGVRLSESDVSDRILEERVRAQIGRVVSHPAALRLTATDGCVEITGPVLMEEADSLVNAIRSVRGVKDVVDRLDVHDAPGSPPTS